ncbi:hypothetical protein [Streptomyces olivaceiscleroticus]|uniref:Uncharacterized protein n=1 Tax=Streptomyces olivaceiscleroticus TaxID=68245 RepID=A0ABP3JXP4_9ACTN
MSALPNTPVSASNSPASSSPDAGSSGGLLLARRRIQAARMRGVTPSDGGGPGPSDGND